MYSMFSGLSAQQWNGIAASALFVSVSLALALWMFLRTEWWVARLSSERLGQWLSDAQIGTVVRVTAAIVVVLSLLVTWVDILSLQAIARVR